MITEESMMVLHPKQLEECGKLFDSGSSKWLLVVTGLDGVGKSTFLKQFQEKYARHIACMIDLKGGHFRQETGEKADRLRFLREISYSTANYCSEEKVLNVEKNYLHAHAVLTQTMQAYAQNSRQQIIADHYSIINNVNQNAQSGERIEENLQRLRNELYTLILDALIEQLATFKISADVEQRPATKYLLIVLDGYEHYSLSELEWLIEKPLAAIHKRIEDKFFFRQSSLRCLVVSAHRRFPSLDEGQIKDNEKANFSLPLVERELVEKYLQYHGISNEKLEEIYRYTHGHPLCLSIFKDFVAIENVSERMRAFYRKAWECWIENRMLYYMDSSWKEVLVKVAFAPYFSQKILRKVLKIDKLQKNFQYKDFVKLPCIARHNGSMEHHKVHPLVQTIIVNGLQMSNSELYKTCKKDKHRFQRACKKWERQTIVSSIVRWWEKIFYREGY